jgi:hypothetical protein
MRVTTTSQRPHHFDDLFSDVMLMDDPRMTDRFIMAGAELLRVDFNGDVSAPLCWLSRRRVSTQALRMWDGRGRAPSEATFRYRWRRQAAYHRDLVLVMLLERMDPRQGIAYGESVLDEVRSLSVAAADGIARIVCEQARILSEEDGYRLQLVFAATLATDERIAEALRRINRSHAEAWARFWGRALATGAIKVRAGLGSDDLAAILCAAIDRIARSRIEDPRTGAIDAADEAAACEPWLAALIGALITA